MASNMMAGLALLFLAPALVSATSFEYYRSVFCDAQSPDFFLESYISPVSMVDDNLCHQTPVRTMAMKITDGLDPACVVLAYDDYGCQSLVGSVPASGKCAAATKTKIGSWKAVCNTTDANAIASFAPGELKRRGKVRLPNDVDAHNFTTSVHSTTCTSDSLVTASSSIVEMSSADKTNMQPTSPPSADNTSNSTISSRAGLGSIVNVTASGTTSTNGSYTRPSMTMRATATVTYIGNTIGNGTAVLHKGVATSNQIGRDRQLLYTVIGGMVAISGAIVLL